MHNAGTVRLRIGQLENRPEILCKTERTVDIDRCKHLVTLVPAVSSAVQERRETVHVVAVHVGNKDGGNTRRSNDLHVQPFSTESTSHFST